MYIRIALIKINGVIDQRCYFINSAVLYSNFESRFVFYKPQFRSLYKSLVNLKILWLVRDVIKVFTPIFFVWCFSGVFYKNIEFQVPTPLLQKVLHHTEAKKLGQFLDHNFCLPYGAHRNPDDPAAELGATIIFCL